MGAFLCLLIEPPAQIADQVHVLNDRLNHSELFFPLPLNLILSDNLPKRYRE